MRWPGRIPAGKSCDEVATLMDLLPTFAKLAGADVPTDRVIDGKDISQVLLGQAKSPHDRFFYHRGNQLSAVRSGRWKYHSRLPIKGRPKAALYDLTKDIGEKKDVAAEHPEVVKRLRGYLAEFEKELGAGNNLSENCRPAGWVKPAKPLSMR